MHFGVSVIAVALAVAVQKSQLHYVYQYPYQEQWRKPRNVTHVVYNINGNMMSNNVGSSLQDSSATQTQKNVNPMETMMPMMMMMMMLNIMQKQSASTSGPSSSTSSTPRNERPTTTAKPPPPCRCGVENSARTAGGNKVTPVSIYCQLLQDPPVTFIIKLFSNRLSEQVPVDSVHHVLALSPGPVLCGDTGGL